MRASGAAEEHDDLPAWSLPAGAAERIALPATWPERVTREWAFGDSDGVGVRVCILDSGIDADHPLVGGVEEAFTVSIAADGQAVVEEDTAGDLCGHGTACAGIVRALAPASRLASVRVLGEGFTGSGQILIEGLRWAVERGYEVVNMSLSTTKRELAVALHEIADQAYFRGTMLVASAHNMPVESFPWRFASVVSVGSHDEGDPLAYYYNPKPPVEFFARGVDVEVAWPGGGSLRTSGNSFATPHMAAICALIRGSHPELTPFQLKTVLYLIATNVGPRE